MSQFKLVMDGASAPVLDRITETYGFGSKIMLAEHFDMAASSISARYRRGGFPSDLVVQCMAETGVTLEWLATGKGKMYENQSADILRLKNHKLIDGEMFEAGELMIDKVMFGAGTPLPSSPISMQYAGW
ncbi:MULTISPECIES: helix-turn-helix transcriptional regulator [Proteus]|uniref:helix-turn-helix transcriptional regulator n=1 Tax=Proteus TaxID=583 RepID=UPI002B4B42AC|nr:MULTISPECIES: helix-turn-helix transcriptional regulator [Proteus]